MYVVVLFAGFTRPASALDALATELQRAGFVTEQPVLCRRWWPLDYMSKRRQQSVAHSLRARFPSATFLLVGHSAGAAAACGVAEFLGPAVRGLVFIDGVDSPRRGIERYLSGSHAPIVALCGAAGSCNRHGALCDHLAGMTGIAVVPNPWMPHGAIEPPGTVVYERACRCTVTKEQHARALTEAVAAVEALARDEIAT